MKKAGGKGREGIESFPNGRKTKLEEIEKTDPTNSNATTAHDRRR